MSVRFIEKWSTNKLLVFQPSTSTEKCQIFTCYVIVSQEEPLVVREEVEDQLGACAVYDFRFRGGVRQL